MREVDCNMVFHLHHEELIRCDAFGHYMGYFCELIASAFIFCLLSFLKSILSSLILFLLFLLLSNTTRKLQGFTPTLCPCFLSFCFLCFLISSQFLYTISIFFSDSLNLWKDVFSSLSICFFMIFIYSPIL